MDRRRAAGALLALAACIACSAAAPTASDHTALDLYDGGSEGCFYNFQHYGEGDRIMTNEPCLNCTCHNKMLMCYLRVCPFTKPIGQDCTVEKRADQCCPIVTCPDVPVDLLTSTSTTSPAEYGATGIGKLDRYGCSINGKYLSEGSKVPPTPNKPCEHCYCIRNMTTCVMQECTLHVDGCTPIYHKDVCCPVRYSCDHPEDEILLLDDMTTTVRPTPGFLLTTTTVSPVTQMTQDCVHDDRVFPDGALIKTEKACEHCYCMKGDIVCVVQECGTPMENEGKNCSSLPPREGQCCPDTYICEGDELSTELPSDVTTQEELTTLSPPRRVGVEGSGYRNEPDEASQTESSATDVEIEGSGEEQSNSAQEVDTSESLTPETLTTVLTDEYLATTEKEQQYIPITSKSPKLDDGEVSAQFPEPSQAIDTIPEKVPDEVSTEPDQYVSSTTVAPAQAEQHILSTTTTPEQGDEKSTIKPIDGHDLIPGTLSEKESSELDQFIPITTSAPMVDIGESDTTEPTEIQDIISSTAPEVSEQEQMIPITTSAPTVEEIKDPSVEPYEGQDVKPDGTTEVETEEPDEFSFTTTTKSRLEDSEKSSVGQDISEPETVTEKKHSEIDHHISSTQIPELEEGEMFTTDTSVGHEETADTITEKESSEPELVLGTTSIPILYETEKESSRPNIVSETITEKEDSDLDQFIPISTSLPALEKYDHLTTKISEERDVTTGSLVTTDSFAPEIYIPTTMSSLLGEKDEKATTVVPSENQDTTLTAISNEQTSVADQLTTRITVTPLIEEGELSTDIPIEEQYITNGVTENENSKPQPTSTPAHKDDKETTLDIGKEHDSGITTVEETSESEESKPTEPTTSKYQIIGAETTTIVSEVSSISKEESYTITTETTLKKEDSIVPTDSQKPLETTTINTQIMTESIDHETKPTILLLPEDQQITKDDEFKESVESTTTAAVKKDEKEPVPVTEGELAFTTEAIDKLQVSETTTINIGENEIDEDSIISSGRIPGEGDCLLNGITYRNESIVPSTNDCHIGCRCISSIIKCEPIVCSPPPEYMNNCQPTYDSSESCCPTYVCDHAKETIPPESQSQMSGTESPVPSPTIECRGDQCEINEEKVQSCTSDGCLQEPNVTPTHPQLDEHSEKCEEGKCESSEEICANGKCQLPSNVEQALPVKPCEGDHCGVKPNESIIPHTPVVLCEGESGSGDCGSNTGSLPQEAETDVVCTEENGCRKPQEESQLECIGESCRRKGSSDIDGKVPSSCTDTECVQLTPTEHSLDTDMSITKTPEEKIDTLDTTREPLVTKDQEAQTELPASYATEIYESQDHVSHDADDLMHKTTSVTSLHDITTLLPDTISESIEIESSDNELQKNVTTELPQTEDIHLGFSGTVAHQDSTKQDVPIISDLESELTTKSLVTENQDLYTKTTMSPTEKSHIVESEVSEIEKDIMVTQIPADIKEIDESTTVVIDKQEMPTKLPSTDHGVEYTEKPNAIPETSECGSEDCSQKEILTDPQSVEHTDDCTAGKCEPPKEICANGDCHVPPVESTNLTELPISQQPVETTEEYTEIDKTPYSTTISDVMEVDSDSTKLVTPKITEEFTEKLYETKTTLVDEATEPQELATKKPEQEVIYTESPHSYVTEPLKETKSPDFNEVDQPSYEITTSPESSVTKLEKETKPPISSELEEVSTKLSEPDVFKEYTTEPYGNTQEARTTLSQDVTKMPIKTVTEMISTLSNELITEITGISHAPEVETDTESTIELELTTKAALPTKHQVETTQTTSEEHNTELPSVFITEAQDSFTNENQQSVTEQISQTIEHVTGSPIAVTADFEQQDMITEKIETSAEPEKPSIIDEIEMHPDSHDTEPQNTTPSITAPQEEISTQNTLFTSDLEADLKITTESTVPTSDEEKIDTVPPKETDVLTDQTGLPDNGLITEFPEVIMTVEPDQTTHKSESDDEKIKTESPEQHEDQEKISTDASTEQPIDKETMLEYPGQPNLVEKEEHLTEIPIHYVTEPDTASVEQIVTEKEHEKIDTVTSKPSISDETLKTGDHEASPEKPTPESNEIYDKNTEVPLISSEQPISLQTIESSTSEPQEESTDEQYITPSKESATVNYQEVITDKTPQIVTESSEQYIPVHQEEPITGTPIVQESVTDLSHKVSDPDAASGTEQYDIATKPTEFVDESYTEISKVDLTEPQELVTEAPEVAITEKTITLLPGVVTEALEKHDEKLEETTDTSKSTITEMQNTSTQSSKVSEDTYTETPSLLVTDAHKDETKPAAAEEHTTSELVETSTVVEGSGTEDLTKTSPEEYVTKPHDLITITPGIPDIEENEVHTEAISLIPEKGELPDSETEMFTTETLTQEVETKAPETMITDSQTLGFTEKPIGSTTLAEEIYTKHPSKLPVTDLEQTEINSSPTNTEGESLIILSTESPIPIITEAQQITTKQPEASTDLQNTSTETPKKSEQEGQEDSSESYLPVTTESGLSHTEKSELVTESEKITEIPDQFVTEKLDTMHLEQHAPVETSSNLPLPEENIITTSNEAEVTSVPKYETPESTPYLIELEEHTHKLEEEFSTSALPEEELTTGKVDIQQEQKVPEITTEKQTVDENTSSETDKITIKEDKTISTVASLLPSNEVYEKSTQSSISTEEITSSPTTSPTQDVDKTYGTDAVITDMPTTAPTTIEKEMTTHTVPADTGVSSIQDLKPTEQTDEGKDPSTETPLKSDKPFVTTPSEPKETTPKIEDATTLTPAPIDKYTKTEEPSETSTKSPDLSKPGSNEIQPTDEVPSPDDGGHLVPSGTSGYGPEPDYFEEDQTFGPGTCRYGGKVYVSAQQIPRDDPCDFCFCFRSDIICLQQSCPPPIHGCHEEPIQGFCCPRYECPVSMATTLNVTTTTTTTTTTLPPHFPTHPYKGAAQRRGCQIKGHTYKVGEVVRASSGPCLHCTCGGDGQMKCDPKACTPEPMLRQMIAAAVSAKRRR